MTKLMYLSLAIMAGMFISCSPTYYVPNTQNVSMLSEQGDFSGNLAGNIDQLEVQAAYAVSDHIGIMANTGFFFPKDEENGSGGSGNLFEGGIGYFTPIGDEGFLFETFGLVGVGNVENHFTTRDDGKTHGDLKAGLFRAAIQPAISFKSKYFSASASSRLAYLNYTSVSGDLIYHDVDQINYLKENNTQMLIEPAITLRGGIDVVKLQVQLGTSLNLTDPDFRQGSNYITAGLHFTL